MSATTKVWLNNNAPSCEDDDLNGFKAENNNLILGSGQVLSTSDNQQTHKAVSDYAASGAFYTDSGIADAYVLDVIGAHVAPPAYVDGMITEFLAGNDNTGASTVNVAGLGVKNIVNTSNADVIVAGIRYILKYRIASGDFEIYISDVPIQTTSDVKTNGQNWDGIDIGGGETLYPDGTIYGVNGNGSYWKYADGRLECDLDFLTVGVNTTATWTFPHAFTEVLSIIPTGYHTSGFSGDVAIEGETGVSSPSLTQTVIRNRSTNIGQSVFMTAIGRWKA